MRDNGHDRHTPRSRMNESIEARLREQLAAVSHRIASIEDELRHELDDDLAEQAVDRADDEPLEAVERTLRDEAQDIEHALARLANGEYGRCAACGEEIGAARLEALPTASLCIACARLS